MGGPQPALSNHEPGKSEPALPAASRLGSHQGVRVGTPRLGEMSFSPGGGGGVARRQAGC